MLTRVSRVFACWIIIVKIDKRLFHSLEHYGLVLLSFIYFALLLLGKVFACFLELCKVARHL